MGVSGPSNEWETPETLNKNYLLPTPLVDRGDSSVVYDFQLMGDDALKCLLAQAIQEDVKRQPKQ